MSGFSFLISQGPEFRSLSEYVQGESFPLGLLGLGAAARHLIIHTLCERFSRGALIVTADEKTAVRCCEDLSLLGTPAALFPARDLNFQAESSSPEYEQRRVGALAQLLGGEKKALVCSVEAALQHTVPPDALRSRIFTLRPGDEMSICDAREKLVRAGYSYAEMVEGAGQFSVRGGILDVFPAGAEQPVRVEFYGDEIDTVSRFDLISQRRTDPLQAADITPCSEILFDSPADFAGKARVLVSSLRGKHAAKARERIERDITLAESGLKPGAPDKYFPVAYPRFASVFDYFDDAFLFVCESSAVKEKAQQLEKLRGEELTAFFQEGVLCRGLDRYYADTAYLFDQYRRGRTCYTDNFTRGSFDTPVRGLVNYQINQTSRWDGSLKVLEEEAAHSLRGGYAVVVFAGTEKMARTLTDELNADNLRAVACKPGEGLYEKGFISVLSGTLSSGVEYPGGKAVLISYGRDARPAQRRQEHVKKNPNAFNSLEELHKGDYIVHVTNGIGIFEGIEQVRMDGVTKDYMRIAYAKGDVLFVPVTKLERVSKYVGPHEEDGSRTVKINRLGSGDWEKTKSRVRSAVKDIAEDLLKIYAARQAMPGFAFSPDIDMQSDFERRFEFDETDDQLRCVDEIKRDMEKPFPMDRLLCGDVGFGKTEVALRAAFKCVCDGKQCAILVPTTILAMQHYRTILHRIEGFPVEVDMISRFRTARDQKKTLARLKTGGVDILVGTHRLISKDVQFKDLGLLIVDEEQRFGVAQKEKLKEKFPNVDVLTLTATPIPRTLNFAMMGIKDLSVIEEAPMDRHPVQTYVVEHEWDILQPAMEKELRRGGQIYYLHNRIDDIEETAGRIAERFPDAAVGVAHGRMDEATLSEVWRQLLEGEIDILVCTTIIETGVDVPNVNTLIIENADRFGLAQLHQLRGRVGRSSRRASVYCTFTPGKEISEIADRRLSAIREYTQFGSGFRIAMRDLQIRGAGNMLGARQHGHMEAVGYDLYVQLLGEAVEALKSGKTAPAPKRDCLVDIQIDAYVPESYIPSYAQRIAIYKRIADIRTQEDAEDVTDELIDRYGEPPECAMGLIKVALMKNTAAANGIKEITQRGNELVLSVDEIDPQTLFRLSALRGRVKSFMGPKPCYTVRLIKNQTPLGAMEQIVFALTAPLPEDAPGKKDA